VDGTAGGILPTVGFGTASIGNLYTPVSETEAQETLEQAWASGIRYFDTAPHYGLGLAEQRLGRMLRDLPRGDYLVSTKVGRLLEPNPDFTGDELDTDGFAVSARLRRRYDYSRDGVLRSLEESLGRLALDRVDLVLVHDPDSHYRQALDEALPALAALKAQGVIDAIGVGMNHAGMLVDFIRNADLDAVMIAGRYTLLDQDAGRVLLPEAKARGVAVLAAGVFNSGILATPTLTADAHYDYAAASDDLIQKARRIAAVCAEHGATLPQAALHFPSTHPATRTVVLSAASAAQLRANSELLAQPVPAALWTDLQKAGLITL